MFLNIPPPPPGFGRFRSGLKGSQKAYKHLKESVASFEKYPHEALAQEKLVNAGQGTCPATNLAILSLMTRMISVDPSGTRFWL